MRAWLFCALLAPLAAYAQSNALQFEIATLPGFARHADLLPYPGLLAVALENVDIRPGGLNRTRLGPRGTELEIKKVIVRFAEQQGSRYVYEVGATLGVAKVSFPVTVDVAALSAGKTTVVADLPLANLISNEARERLQAKVTALGNPAGQQKLLDYLDDVAKRAPPKDRAAFAEALLVDAYNRNGGPTLAARDVGDAIPLSEQWMLILTLLIWVIVVPTVVLAVRWRRRRAKPA